MFVRILTLRFDDTLGAFDDTPVQELLKDKIVVAIREHFFVKNAVPYLTLVVTYDLAEAAAPASAGTKPASVRWHDLLDPTARPLFQTLRDWRRERSKQDGVPPYVICTDRILAGNRPTASAKPDRTRRGARRGTGQGEEVWRRTARPAPDRCCRAGVTCRPSG